MTDPTTNEIVQLGGALYELARDQAEWSHATFGGPDVRGPTGPLLHMVKEILVELLGWEEKAVEAFFWLMDGNRNNKPSVVLEYTNRYNVCRNAVPEAGGPVYIAGREKLLKEYADLLILFNDAMSRTPLPPGWPELVAAAREKMVENKQREWPTAKTAGSNDKPVEHDREKQ